MRASAAALLCCCCCCGRVASTRTPVLLWADRFDRLFLTALVPHLDPARAPPEVELHTRGRLTLDALAADEHYSLNVTLQGEIVPAGSSWRAKRGRVELSIRKAERGRWEGLLAGAFDAEIKVDWSKYKDADEEMDEEERSAGIRGPPVVGNPGLARAVDEYYQRARTERVQSGELPDLETVSKLAEAEHARSGGDFDEIVQRLWGEARRTLEVQRRLEAREEAWAQKSDL